MRFLSSFLLFILFACKGPVDPYVEEIKQIRRQQTKDFLNKDSSPLDDKDRATFLGLDYFPANEKYKVKCALIPEGNPFTFSMKTTTDRLPTYQKVARLEFEFEGRKRTLFAYRDEGSMDGSLFVPFTDKTNGNSTYKMGRYIDIYPSESDDLYLDFNLCYNPYCAYSDRWSCPIPPAENTLDIAIEAGVKKWKH